MKKSISNLITISNTAAVCFFLLTLLTAWRYGFYGDELYYIACSKHLAFGYVDHPPLVAFLTLICTWIFGESIIGLRILSGLAGAITIFLSAKIAKTLGGGKLSQSLAALSICFATAFLGINSFLSMNPIDITLGTLFIYILMKTIASPSPKKWITIGILLGIGLLNKYTFLVLGFALLISLIITKRWSVLRSIWIYIGGLIGLIIFLPHIIWQIQNGWPTLEFMSNAAEYKNLSLSPVAFLLQLTIGLNPFTLPIWLCGLIYLLFSKEMKEYRYLGWVAVVFILVYAFQNSKFYYVLPIIPLLFSSGAVAVERFLNNHRSIWPKWVMVSLIVVSGTLLIPLAVPIMPVNQFVSYAKTLGIWNLIRLEKGEGDKLPLHFVHRVGWEELVETVAAEYNALPQNEKSECAILASWYGIAGAIDHFGSKYGLPNAICPHNNYWMWGTQNYSGEVVLVIGYNVQFLKQYFDKVERVAHFENPYANGTDIYLCKKPKESFEQIWNRLKRFI